MNDLFDPTSSPHQPAPAYGSLSPSDEARLYRDDRGRWIAYVAPTMARKLVAAGTEALAKAWPLMERDYQRAVWRELPPDAQAAFRAALNKESIPT